MGQEVAGLTYRTENLCNGCGECINCGRNRDIEIPVCDFCGNDLKGHYHEVEDKCCCSDCLLANFSTVTDTECEVCDNDMDDFYYQANGVNYCRDCFLELFKV